MRIQVLTDSHPNTRPVTPPSPLSTSPGLYKTQTTTINITRPASVDQLPIKTPSPYPFNGYTSISTIHY